ncbi:DUF998 domain-containing protein [uncultured Jatrophihabitans sp.]|uniref:DUF998 domain-containing protein n=1 Tax=uncultured Jatrophihabitans sp. TaxID=1610747 RepID=UPI0035C9AFD6
MGQVALPLSRPPAWALLSSAFAPVVLVTGWTVGGALQAPGYDAVHDTISALAAYGAQHRWIMTAALAGLGAAHTVTGAGLRSVHRWPRLVLIAAGLATLAVAAFPEPARGSSNAHAVFAAVAFVLLAGWPATLARASGTAPLPERRPVAYAVAAVSVALLIWFALTLAHGPLGVSERVLTAQQALWPLVVVVWARRTSMLD